jgi:hypothetical protein
VYPLHIHLIPKQLVGPSSCSFEKANLHPQNLKNKKQTEAVNNVIIKGVTEEGK